MIVSILFWALWILDVIFCLTLGIAKGFRKSFTASDPTAWVTVLLYGCTIISLVLRFLPGRAIAALIVAAIPLLTMLLWAFLSGLTGNRV